uniref:Uncharacterized protein n=1 Tax=Timema poppense TaxID=170557 RepID=A0A7R9H4M9_TIMPO|nr:unnamed protein product [Timema poppensis]
MMDKMDMQADNATTFDSGMFEKAFAAMTTVWTVAGAIVLPNLGGWFGAYYNAANVKTWYPTLKLPSWRPPNYLFGPVWTVLYSSMGYASYLVWRDGGGFYDATTNKGSATMDSEVFNAHITKQDSGGKNIYSFGGVMQELGRMSCQLNEINHNNKVFADSILKIENSVGQSLAEISVLWVNVAACVYTFHQVNPIAGYILLPYLAWLSVASALNYVIWRDNPEKKEK